MTSSKYISYTIYVKRQPRPLIGDEIWPDGCVGIHFNPTPSMTSAELAELIADLSELYEAMGAKR